MKEKEVLTAEYYRSIENLNKIRKGEVRRQRLWTKKWRKRTAQYLSK